LFGTRGWVDLRIPDKARVEDARVLGDCAAHPAPDTTILITLPRLDRAASSSAWFAALEQGGVTVEVHPLERADLPRWIASRLERQQQRATAETLQFLADTTEGNLLAARQELEKIGLLLPQGELDPAAVEDAVADVRAFDVFQLGSVACR
jgi:DNA polymerase-3 subunit delta